MHYAPNGWASTNNNNNNGMLLSLYIMCMLMHDACLTCCAVAPLPFHNTAEDMLVSCQNFSELCFSYAYIAS